MAYTDWIGWVSSGVLVVTLVHQVIKLWREEKSEGVSIWLFVGQFTASVGFTAYSVLLRNWVFTITNSILIANSVVGYLVTLRNRRRRGRLPNPAEASEMRLGATPNRGGRHLKMTAGEAGASLR